MKQYITFILVNIFLLQNLLMDNTLVVFCFRYHQLFLFSRYRQQAISTLSAVNEGGLGD